eukprot:366178-Chlamydomonas_euryale.AAC.13
MACCLAPPLLGMLPGFFCALSAAIMRAITAAGRPGPPHAHLLAGSRPRHRPSAPLRAAAARLPALAAAAAARRPACP